ncbi:peptide-methionine (S)-S-oxide reductase [Alteromonadaceae bacterium 2753L.S.0a.02]|nr:peptide-methionine (S)-S-oxide reductase [Alteromonadaceae bacterium 2753L.S.0a.02]
MDLFDRLNARMAAKMVMPRPEDALPGRDTAICQQEPHFVLKRPIVPPFPESAETLILGMGCFWGAEKRFWSLDGVLITAVGYSAGYTVNPTYEEVCSGKTGHNEVVLVVFDPVVISLETVLAMFWESHDPTQGMRQGNDVGTQYRSGLYVSQSQISAAQASRDSYQKVLTAAGYGEITTEICEQSAFYYAEVYHQQYLAKNPDGYCGLGGIGLKFCS